MAEENARLRSRPHSATDGERAAAVKSLIKKIQMLEHELRTPFADRDAAAHVAAIGKHIPADDQLSRALLRELLDEVRFHAPGKIRAVHKTVERKLARLVARLPSKTEARRLKIAALAADPAPPTASGPPLRRR